MHLKGTDGPLLANASLDGGLQGASLVVAIHQNHHFASVHHSSNTHRQRQFGHLVHVALKEARVGNNGIGCQRLHTRAAGKR